MTKVMRKIPVAKPCLDEREENSVVNVLRSGWISQGPRCLEFEKKMASYVGVTYGRAVNSGTSAIHLSLLSCRVGKGDDVICPAFTCAATLNPVEFVGARPVPVDICKDDFAMNPALIEKALTARTKAIIVVHLFGLAAKVKEIKEISSHYGVSLIEDASLGLGASVEERSVGTFGDAACLSFHPRKIMTSGEGGMVLTDSEEIASRVESLRNYGASASAWERHRHSPFCLPRYQEAGYNYKLTDIQAAVGLEQLSKLPAMIRKRIAIADEYDRAFSLLDWMETPLRCSGRRHVYQSYVCRIRVSGGRRLEELADVRLRLFKHLQMKGIASVPGAQSMADIDYYSDRYGWKKEDYPVSLHADLSAFALPIYPDLSDEEQALVIDAVRSFHP